MADDLGSIFGSLAPGERDTLLRAPRNPARAPPAVEDFVADMTVNPLWDVAKGIGAVASGYGTAPEVGAGIMGAIGLMSPGARVPMMRGAGLPMDQASRMARAQKMGFDTAPWYHGTADDFAAFDLSKSGARSGSENQKAAFLTRDPRYASHASEVAGIRGLLPGETPHGAFGAGGPRESYVYDGSAVMPLLSRAQKVKEISGPEAEFYNTAAYDKIITTAKKQGHDAVLFKNTSEGGDQLAVLKPEMLRSLFAAFDPAKKNSANLLAGVAGAGVVGSDDSLIDILRKYGLAGAVAGPAAAASTFGSLGPAEQ